MAHILFATFGSYGDLHPYLAIGIELQARGHAVTVATHTAYGDKVQTDGLQFHAVRPNFIERERMTAFMDPKAGAEFSVRHYTEQIRQSYEDTLGVAQDADVVVSHPLTFAAVLVAQKLGKPWISSVLAPTWLSLKYDPPVPAGAPWARLLGPVFLNQLWKMGRRFTLDWIRPVIEFRAELGLPAGGNPIVEGQYSPSLVLALFSSYLARQQPDWPANTRVTGFPFYDRGEIPADLERFLDQGPAPLVFTLGSAETNVYSNFYVRSLAAVERLKCRAVLLTGTEPQGLPSVLPSDVIAVPYAPYGSLFPRAAAIVHQGGIGTTGHAMRSGRPSVVVPFVNDQFDNAERFRRLGAGRVVYRNRYTVRRAESELRRLLGERSYQDAAAALGEKVRAEAGASMAADAIEAHLNHGQRV